MADTIDEILNERFNTPTETQTETATTETTTAEQETTTEVQAEVAPQEEQVEETATISEITEPETPSETATPAATETTTAEPQNDTPLQTLFQKLGVKDEVELESRITELQSLRNKNTLGKLIDDLAAKGVDPLTAVTFHNLDIDKLSPHDKIAWETKMRYPQLSDDKINALIEEAYGDGTDLAKAARLDIDSANAAKSLAEMKSKVLDPTPIQQTNVVSEEEKAEAARIDAWTKTEKVKEVLGGFNKIEEKLSFSTFGEGKLANKSFNYAYPVSQKDALALEQDVRTMAIANGLDPNAPESATELREMAKNLYFVRNKETILKSVASTVASQLHKEYALKFNNSETRTTGAQIGTGSSLSEKDKRLEATINTL